MEMDEKTQERERRGRILVDRDFQLRFIGRLGGTLLFYLLLFLVISIVAPVAFTFLGDPPEWAVMETAFRVEVLLRLILAPLVCTFLCLFFHGILETFRIAGPNHRFKTIFRGLQEFRVPRGVQIRKGDFLQDTAREFDEALVAVHDQVLLMQQQARAAADLTRLALDGQEDETSRAAIAAAEGLEQATARFKLCSRAPACLPLGANGQPVEPMAERPAETASAKSPDAAAGR
jgi:hypothetical protein